MKDELGQVGQFERAQTTEQKKRFAWHPRQAYEYVSKPFLRKEAVELAERALKQDASPAIEVIFAKLHWMELLIPCTREAAERIQSFLMKLEADLPGDLRCQERPTRMRPGRDMFYSATATNARLIFLLRGGHWVFTSRREHS